MVNIVLDKSGRAVFPKEIREKFDTNVFEVIAGEKKITLKPKKGLLSLFGKFPELDNDEFLREKKEEIAREDSS